MAVDSPSMFAQVIQEHLELKRRNSALEHEMPLGKYMHDDPFENHPLFKTEEQARIEETMDGSRASSRTPPRWTGRRPRTRSSTSRRRRRRWRTRSPRRTRPSKDSPRSAPTRTCGRARATSTGATSPPAGPGCRASARDQVRVPRRYGCESRAQRLSSIALDRPERGRAAEVERAGGEDLRARDRLVVGHLRGDARAEEVGDLREDERARRRLRGRRVDLDPVAADELAEGRSVGEPGAVPQPRRGRRSPGR